MSAVELVQVSLSLAGVLIGGGVWFRLGSLTKGQEDLGRRVSNLENHVYLGGYKA